MTPTPKLPPVPVGPTTKAGGAATFGQFITGLIVLATDAPTAASIALFATVAATGVVVLGGRYAQAVATVRAVLNAPMPQQEDQTR